MNIEKSRNEDKLTLCLSGRLDTNTSPDLEKIIKTELTGITELVINMQKLTYLSSAGLRVLLLAQKNMNRQGSMTVCQVGEEIMDVLKITGFVDILHIVTLSEETSPYFVKAETENLQKVLDYINRYLDGIQCPLRIQRQIDMAAEEIFVNIARYAYEAESSDAGIQVEVEQEPLRIAITFVDHGIPYDPLQQEEPDIALSAEERQIGGLGIYLVKKSMDDVCYEYKDGKNILTIRKQIPDEG